MKFSRFVALMDLHRSVDLALDEGNDGFMDVGKKEPGSEVLNRLTGAFRADVSSRKFVLHVRH